MLYMVDLYKFVRSNKMLNDMLDPEQLFTGFLTQKGEKVYLGDKLIAPFMHSFVVQFDPKNKCFVAGAIGKNRPYYRSYDLQDLLKNPVWRVVHNLILFQQVEINDIITISVDNLPKNSLALHEKANVTAVDEWEVIAQSLSNPNQTAKLQYGQFLEDWRKVKTEPGL